MENSWLAGKPISSYEWDGAKDRIFALEWVIKGNKTSSIVYVSTWKFLQHIAIRISPSLGVGAYTRDLITRSCKMRLSTN